MNTIKFAIRDDDANYFTNPDDLDRVFGPFMRKGVIVTFAVVPMVTDVLGNCPETLGNTIPQWVGDNDKLVKWFKTNLKQNTCEIAMHGITHEYKYLKGKRFSEMEWRIPNGELKKMIFEYKSRMESLFDTNIKWFVAPHNDISYGCLNTVVHASMDYSGIVPVSFQRRWTIRNIFNYLKRWKIRLIDGIPYPGVLTYSDHFEINACALGNDVYLDKIYRYCCSHHLPMVINTHYWALRDKPLTLKRLNVFVEKCLNNGAIPCGLGDIIA